MKSEHALSEMVATALIIVLVVMLVAIIAAFLSGFINLTQKSAFIAPNIGTQSISGKNVIALFNRGGDTAYLNMTGLGQYKMSVWIDNASGSYRALPLPGVNAFSPGTTLYVYYNRTGSTWGFNITNKNTDIASATAQPVPPGAIRIRLIDEQSHFLIANWSTAESGSPYPLATVTGRTNATGYRGWPLIESITGTNFFSGSTSKLNRTGSPDIPATTCTYVSSTRLICTYDLLGKTASPPNYNIVVTNPDGRSGMLSNTLTLSSPAPAITSSTPATGAQAATVIITRLLGTGFQPGATVVYSLGATSVPLQNINVVASTNITGTLVIPSDATVGSYTVDVTNTDGQVGTRASTFSVTSNAPTMTSITPNTGNRGWPVSITNLAGSRFQPGAVVKLVNSTAGPDITATNVVINPTNTSITCTFDLTGVPAARRNVTVTNPDGKTGTLANGFTVNSNAPTITSSTPATGAQAATVIITRLLGTNFQPGATAVYSLGATSIPLQNINVVASTNITGMLVIPSDATVGSYSVTVTNTDGQSVTRAATFTVTSNAPKVTARSNATIYRGWMGYELITGTNFVSGAQSVINTTTGNSIPSTSCDVRSSTQMFCSYDLLGVPVSTAYRVAVMNTDGKSGLMTTNLVSVSSPAPTIPATPVFSPSTGARGANGVVVTAPGTYLQPGMAVVLTSANAPVTTITASPVNVVSPTQVIFTFDIPVGATTGSYTARYTNNDGQTVTRTARFTVT